MKTILIALTLIGPMYSMPAMDISTPKTAMKFSEAAKQSGSAMRQVCDELHAQGWDRMDSKFFYVMFCKPIGYK